MDELLQTILTRRSIRKYEDRSIPGEMIKKMLSAAMYAPSAGNAQPWHFVVVTDEELRLELSQVHPYVRMAAAAPVSILVCAEPALEKYPGYWIIDCAAAVQNLLLAAHSLGLGGVWTGVCPDKERMKKIRDILGLPQSIVPHSLIPIGWPADIPKHPDRFNPERIHTNGW